jgi:O-antigen ligase
LFFVTQLIGLLYTQNINLGLKKITTLLPIFFLPAIISVETLNKNYYDKLLQFLKYTILIIFVLYLCNHFFIERQTFNNFVHFTIHDKLKISQFYLIFILLIPFLESIKQLINKQHILLNSIVLIASILFLSLLGNKTAFLLLGLLALGFIIKNAKTNKKMVLIMLPITLILASLVYQLPIVKNRISVIIKTTSFDLDVIKTKNRFALTKNTLEHRILINHLSIREIKKNLPFGVGTGDFQEVLNNQYKKVGFKFGMEKSLNNHNQYLEEFLKTGVLGGFIFIILISLLWKEGLINNNFGLIFILFFSVGCLAESYLNRQHGVVIFAFFIPFFLNQKR